MRDNNWFIWRRNRQN